MVETRTLTTILGGNDNTVQNLDGISVIHVGGTFDNWNSLDYTNGISSRTVGAKEFSMDLATFPPGAVAKAHIHVGFEVGVFMLSGRLEHKYGPYLSRSVVSGAGELLYIAPGVPHEVYNLSDIEPAVMVVVRTSADQWDDIVGYDPLTNQAIVEN